MKTKAEVYKEFAKLIQRGISNGYYNFLGYVERNELHGLEVFFSKRTYEGTYMYDWVNGNDEFKTQLNIWEQKWKETGKKVTLKEIETYLK